MSLKHVEKIKSFAERGKKAKLSFKKKLQAKTSKGENKSKVCTKKTKGKNTKQRPVALKNRRKITT